MNYCDMKTLLWLRLSWNLWDGNNGNCHERWVSQHFCDCKFSNKSFKCVWWVCFHWTDGRIEREWDPAGLSCTASMYSPWQCATSNQKGLIQIIIKKIFPGINLNLTPASVSLDISGKADHYQEADRGISLSCHRWWKLQLRWWKKVATALESQCRCAGK